MRRQDTITSTRIIKELNKKNPRIKSLQQIRASVITGWLKVYNLRKVQVLAGHRYVSSTEQYLSNDVEELTHELLKHHPIN